MSLVSLERRGDVAVLTLTREEKLNAISTAMEAELGEALADGRVATSACVVVTGGERAFSAGADVNELADRDPEAIAAYYRSTGDVYERVAALPQPTVAAISGYCLGGGLELALACDFRVAAADAVFGLPEVEIGIVPSSGGTLRLVRLVGTARAKELVLLRDRVDADEARRLGIVTEVVPPGGSLERALELAERLAGLPRLAAATAKGAIDAMPDSSREAGLAIERLAYALLAQTAEAQDAVERFGKR